MMSDPPTTTDHRGSGGFALLPWLAVGCAAGFVDGTAGLLVDREVAGSLAHRLHTLLVSGALLGMLFAAAGSTAAVYATLRRRPRPLAAGRLRHRVIGTSAVVALAALVIAVFGFSTSRTAASRSPNVILISIDTLRADHLGAYGYARDTSANLDALARDGVLFAHAFAQAPWTLPSHASMLTGLGPLAHGAVDLDDVLTDAHETLAERLARRGYDTAAFVGGNSSSFIGAGRRLDQGFGFYRHYPHPRPGWGGLIARRVDHARLKWIDRHVGNAQAEIASTLRWIETRAHEPFFVFLHMFDVHSKTVRLPYEAPAPFRERFCSGAVGSGFDGCAPGGPCASAYLHQVWSGALPAPSAAAIDRMQCLYDGGIAFVDHELGRLFDELRRLGLWENTLVVVTADHGEAFFEHGVPDHTELYDEVLHVPLILHGPGIPKGQRNLGLARTVDIAPTLVAIAGDTARFGEGRSLLPALANPPLAGDGGEIADLAVNKHRGDSVSLRKGQWKYVVHAPTEDPRAAPRPPEELFDLASDPRERTNLVRAATERRLEALRTDLERVRLQDEQLYQRVAQASGKSRIRLEPDDMERLRALGYVD
jgi:arylsulfatase A-like enzyme